MLFSASALHLSLGIRTIGLSQLGGRACAAHYFARFHSVCCTHPPLELQGTRRLLSPILVQGPSPLEGLDRFFRLAQADPGTLSKYFNRLDLLPLRQKGADPPAERAERLVRY